MFVLLRLFLVATFFSGFRFLTIPLYDIILIFTPIYFVRSIRKINVVVLLYLLFLLMYFSYSIFSGYYAEGMRYLLAACALLFGFSLGVANIDLDSKVYNVMFFLTLILPFALLIKGEVGNDYFSIKTFSGDRFSGFFADPTKLAAFYYLLAITFRLSKFFPILVALPAKTRMAVVFLVAHFFGEGRSKYLITIAASLAVATVIIFFPYVNDFLLALTAKFRPEFDQRESVDGIRTMSMVLLYKYAVLGESFESLGVLGMRSFFNGTVPPHNTFLSTILEVGLIASYVLMFAVLYFLVKVDVRFFMSALIISTVFLLYDSQSYRLLYFCIGYISGRSMLLQYFKNERQYMNP